MPNSTKSLLSHNVFSDLNRVAGLCKDALMRVLGRGTGYSLTDCKRLAQDYVDGSAVMSSKEEKPPKFRRRDRFFVLRE